MYRLLIIDDQKSILQMLKRRFAKLNYDVFTADNGTDAFQILETTPIDLVLLDYTMPQVSGFDFYLSFKKQYDLPVIMMTAHSSVHLVIEFMKNGGTDFIEKPLDMDLLSLRIEQAIKQARLIKEQTIQKQKAEEELRKNNVILLEKTKKLEQKNKELDAFAAAVSHDLRAPVNNVIGLIDLVKIKLETETANSEIDLYFELIEKSINRMKLLISELLGFAKMQQVKKNIEEIDTQQLVAEVVSTINADEMNNPQFKFTELPKIKGDLILIRQVFYNLIHNAAKYSRIKPTPLITIIANTDNHEVVFAVKDNGIGFNLKNANVLYNIFTRAHSNDYEGIGIGLANVKRIVERHDGRVWAEGEEGKGATFYFALPHNFV